MSKEFIHLHVHSSGSLLDGMCIPDKLAEKCKELGMSSVAVTEHGNIYSGIKFYSTMKKNGIKPIMGFEAYIAPDMSIKDKDQAINHLVLLAKNLTGYRNLLKLSSLSFTKGFYGKPRIDFETLKQHGEGVIVLSACLAGEIPRALTAYKIVQPKITKRHKNKETGENHTEVIQEEIRELLPFEERYANALAIAKKYQDVFHDDFYIEVQNHGIQEQIEVIPHLINIANELGIKVVATNDSHYINKEDAKAHGILLEIQGIGGLEGFESFDEFYIKSYDEMAQLFPEEYLDVTVEIANKCDVRIEEIESEDINGNEKAVEYYFPDYEVPEGETVESFMYKLCEKGFDEKVVDVVPDDKIAEYMNRFEYEFEVINTMGFCSYFIILWDIINFCHEKDIPVGPGRGSAAGSLVSYLMGITTIDPIKYDLLFERFLNPERISMPDIDTDFCYDRIGEVLEYVENKYGKDHVCKIGTFGTLGTKAVLKDVARALEYDYDRINYFTKNMPTSFDGDEEDEVIKLTVSSAVERIPELRKAIAEDPLLAEVVEISKELQGLNRHVSKHAAGVIISPKDKPLEHYVALRSDPDGSNITAQGDMSDLENLGFVKMDFLRLRTLTVVKDCLNLIKKNRGKDIDVNKIPLDDVMTLDLLRKGNSVGVFQFESDGMQSLLKGMKPERFEDLIALNALYRPGPLDAIDEETGMTMVQIYVARKRGDIPIKYLHPILEPILKETYGVIVYQEQCMKIAVEMAGYTLAQADELRSVVGKKKLDKMPKQRAKFLAGAIENGIDEHTATTVWEQIETFGSYGFNKSHSCAYATLAFISAYLKVHYTTEFMCALLTSVMGNTNKFNLYLKESKRMNVQLLPPDVRESEEQFIVSGDAIRFGLFGIKDVGKVAIQAIKNMRSTKQIDSFLSFYMTVDTRVVNKSVLTNLIYCGAFDFLGQTRATLINGLENILEINKKIKTKISGNSKRKKPVDDISVFYEPLLSFEMKEFPEYSMKELLEKERELTGLYITANPLELCQDVIKKNASHNSISLMEADEGITAFTGGIISLVTEFVIKKGRNKGKKMAKVVLNDADGEIKVTFFVEIYSAYKNIITVGNVVIVKGKTNAFNGEMQVNADEVFHIDIDEIVANNKSKKKEEVVSCADTLNIMVEGSSDNMEVVKQIGGILSRSKGSNPVNLIFVEDFESFVLPISVKVTDLLLEKLTNIHEVLNAWQEKV